MCCILYSAVKFNSYFIRQFTSSYLDAADWESRRKQKDSTQTAKSTVYELIHLELCASSPSSIILYRPSGVISLAGKVTTGLVESNGSLSLGL